MLEEGLRRQIWKVVTDLRLTASCSDRGNQFGIWWFPICTVSYLSWGRWSNNQIWGDFWWKFLALRWPRQGQFGFEKTMYLMCQDRVSFFPSESQLSPPLSVHKPPSVCASEMFVFCGCTCICMKKKSQRLCNFWSKANFFTSDLSTLSLLFKALV